jgi:cholesterol 7-dehydrogenase
MYYFAALNTSVPQSAKAKSWPCDELNGFILVWYHAEQEEPNWKAPLIPEIAAKKWTYGGRSEYRVNAHIQEIPENGSDIAHLDCLHGPSMLYGSDLKATLNGKRDNRIAPFLKHHWSVIWARDPEEKHVAVSKLHHEIRVFGRLSFISVEVEAKQIGPGLVYLTFTSPLFGRCILFESVTPVEPMVQRVLHRLYAPLMMKGPFGNLIVWGEAIMVCLMSYIIFPF